MEAIDMIESPPPFVNNLTRYKTSRVTIDDVKKMLESSAQIAVANCSCRTCERGPDACLIIYDTIKTRPIKGEYRKISLDEAFEIASQADALGLGFMEHIWLGIGYPKRPSFICISCSCCHNARERAGSEEPRWVGCDPLECWKDSDEAPYRVKCGECRVFAH